jgi:hypothetical protein
MGELSMLQKSLDRIADVMQVPLVYDSKITPPIDGKGKAHYAPLPGLDIAFTVRAEKLFYSDQVGVLFHVLGSLWAMVAHYDKTNSTTMFLIDGGKVGVDGTMITPDKMINKKGNLMEAVDILRPAIVKSFIFKGGVWTKLPLPK